MGVEKAWQVCDRAVCEWDFDGRDHSDRNGNAGTAAKGTGIQRVIVLQVLVHLRRLRVREWGENLLITSSLTCNSWRWGRTFYMASVQTCFSFVYVCRISIYSHPGETFHYMYPSVLSSNTPAESSTFIPVGFVSVQPASEHRNRIGGISGSRLCHVPVLNNARSIHPINVCQRNGFFARNINTHVDETDVVVEVLTKNCGGNERDDCQAT